MANRNPQASEYRRLEYLGAVSPTNTSFERNLSKTWNVQGDHLTVHSISGGAPVYVQLSGDEQDGNPFIRVREGMVLARSFKRVTFRIGNSRLETASTSLLSARVVAFTSFGPLFANIPAKEYGLRRGFVALYDLEASTTSTELGTYLGKTDHEGYPTFGKGGGSLTLMNTDLANDIYLIPSWGYSNSAPYGSRGFGPIRPGQSVTLTIEDPMLYNAAEPDVGGLIVKTLSGTAKFSLIVSSGEMDDVDGEQATQHHQEMK